MKILTPAKINPLLYILSKREDGFHELYMHMVPVSLFDTLTFTVGSGDEKLRDAAIQTLDAIKRIKAELPGCHTILGLSNISFGLPVPARKVLNAVFLHEAIEAGLDAVILNCRDNKLMEIAGNPQSGMESDLAQIAQVGANLDTASLPW